MTRSDGMKIVAKPALSSVERTNLFADRTNDLIEWVSVNSGRLTSWHCAQWKSGSKLDRRPSQEFQRRLIAKNAKASFSRSALFTSPLPPPSSSSPKENFKRNSHHERIETKRYERIIWFSNICIRNLTLCRIRCHYSRRNIFGKITFLLL